MKLQVLVSTMHQKDHSLLDKMNIQSEAIVINQCDENSFEDIEYKGNKVRFISLNERGVGLSRNTALMRATGDICLFADSDVTYVDNYEEIIINEFNELGADVVIFNVPSTNLDRGEKTIKKRKRLRSHNGYGFGTPKIAVRLESIRKANIYFSLLFGGGAKYSCGEDTLFIKECFAKGLKIYGSPKVIGTVSHNESTWFKGFNDKYFFDKGVLYAHISKWGAPLLCLRYAIKRRNIFKHEKNWIEAYKLMLKGVREVRSTKLWKK